MLRYPSMMLLRSEIHIVKLPGYFLTGKPREIEFIPVYHPAKKWPSILLECRLVPCMTASMNTTNPDASTFTLESSTERFHHT